MIIDNTDFNIEQVRKMTKSEFIKAYAGSFTKTDINQACKMLGVNTNVKEFTPKSAGKKKKEEK